jgi:two-component system, OmpR family, sensor kinase
MSLRWRLTLYSTIILGLVLVIFGVVAYNTVSGILYAPIDENLHDQSKSNLIYMKLARYHNMQYDAGTTGQFNSVYFTVIDVEHQLAPLNPDYPVDEAVLPAAFAGQEVLDTIRLMNGTRVRILSQPIYETDLRSGEKVITKVLQAATPLDILDQTLSRLSTFLVVASVIMLAVVAIGSNMLAGRALQVVNGVTRKARQIETSGDLAQRIADPETDDEVGDLVRTFNGMLARLDAAFEAQRRFVADSSHELRTPLTVIKGNLHLLKRATDPAERAEIIAITEAETSRLNRMVNDLLYMAQMQAGHVLKPVVRPVELDSLLLDVFALSRSMAVLKEQEVLLAHEDIASTLGDRDQLQHLLLNLVDNAVKYTPPGGTISIGLWNDGDWARLEVSDTGQGIPAADIPMLFERFFRSPEARRTENRGAGLGLAIVKSIVDAHGGRIEVFSEVDEGSTFRVWLPLEGATRIISRPVRQDTPAGIVRKLLPTSRRATETPE